MKLAPIINQLATELPLYSPYFSDALLVDSLVTSGTTATVTTVTNHGLITGDYVLLSGAIDVTPIDSLDLVDGVVTAMTSIDNSLSMAMSFKDLTPNPQVEIFGANETIFNGTFNLESVPNRLTFTYFLDEPDQSATGQLQAYNYASYRFFDAKQVTVISPTEFTFSVEEGFDGPILGNIIVLS